MSEPWDWPSRDEERRRGSERIIEDVEYRVVRPRRQRRPVRFGTALLAVTVATVIALAVIMLFAFAGIETPAGMPAVVSGLVIILAARLHSRLSERPFYVWASLKTKGPPFRDEGPYAR
jgi:hypothetical protein